MGRDLGEHLRSFDAIYEIASERKGGSSALEALVSLPVPRDALLEIADDRWLAQFSKNVFNAGFNWSVVDKMWPGFEVAFKGFDVAACAMMDDTWFDALVTDTRIVRHGAKIQAVQQNAVFLQELAAEHGSVARCFADWPKTDFVGLLAMLRSRGTRLGGTTGAYALRFMGVDGFILTRDVTARLVAEGVVDKTPTSKTALRAVQDAFNTWSSQSGRSLTEISRVLAMSVG